MCALSNSSLCVCASPLAQLLLLFLVFTLICYTPTWVTTGSARWRSSGFPLGDKRGRSVQRFCQAHEHSGAREEGRQASALAEVQFGAM